MQMQIQMMYSRVQSITNDYNIVVVEYIMVQSSTLQHRTIHITSHHDKVHYIIIPYHAAQHCVAASDLLCFRYRSRRRRLHTEPESTQKLGGAVCDQTRCRQGPRMCAGVRTRRQVCRQREPLHQRLSWPCCTAERQVPHNGTPRPWNVG
mgnify:CR=1 FL=1